MTSSKKRRHGLLIVDHGTRSAEANAPLAQLARRVAEARPDWLVEHAHMELAEPDFEAGVDRLVARGAETILVHLHFLGAGYHVRETIPDLVRAARKRHPHLPIETTSPLGEDQRIADIVVDRMDARSARDDVDPRDARSACDDVDPRDARSACDDVDRVGAQSARERHKS